MLYFKVYNSIKHDYIKALLQEMYEKYSGIKWQIQHEVKPSAVFDIRPHPEYCAYPYMTIGVLL